MTIGFTQKQSFRMVGGNQSLARELARTLGAAVQLESVVTGVSFDQTGVQLSISRRGLAEEVTCDRVVITVPLAIARELSFSPALPEWKTQAWQRAGLGHAAKLHVPMESAASPGAVQDVPNRFWTWTATDATGSVQPVLHCFSGSGLALDALAVEQGPASWALRARALRPELDLSIGDAMVTTWSDDPFARQAYSALTVDVAEGDDHLMERPVDRLHFAGEHTAGAWAGLMEGALRSGERAAAEVVSASP